jgi:hypothetical protein
MSFKTDRPLFPYREPDSKDQVAALNAPARLLRIYFLAEGRYAGELTQETPWTGKAVWANRVAAQDRQKLCEMLRLAQTAGPKDWWLTEFEDHWPHRVAPADLYFSVSATQDTLKRPPITVYVISNIPNDVSIFAIAALMICPLLVRRLRR